VPTAAVTPAVPGAPAWRRDAAWALAGLALLAAWDASGLDLAAARLFGSAQGFAPRDTWWANRVLHDGGRWAAWAVLAALALPLLRRPPAAAAPPQPGRGERGFWVLAMLLTALVVPLLKRASLTSCPWDLAEFGGTARYVSHWLPGVADGGGGHCFPSGHAVSAFVFFGAVLLWRPHQPARARLWLLGVGLAGVLLGLAQLVRGAHYPSHTLWTAWVCWVVLAAADAARRWRTMRCTPAAPQPRRPTHEPDT
jgi:membrane-associated PAP2 superfamily phosphatase